MLRPQSNQSLSYAAEPGRWQEAIMAAYRREKTQLNVKGLEQNSAYAALLLIKSACRLPLPPRDFESFKGRPSSFVFEREGFVAAVNLERGNNARFCDALKHDLLTYGPLILDTRRFAVGTFIHIHSKYAIVSAVRSFPNPLNVINQQAVAPDSERVKVFCPLTAIEQFAEIGVLAERVNFSYSFCFHSVANKPLWYRLRSLPNMYWTLEEATPEHVVPQQLFTTV